MRDSAVQLTMVATSLEPIFRPRSIAVIGAGRDPSSVSGQLFRNLRSSFAGDVFPVNPRSGEIDGVRSYPSMGAVPQPVDLAFVVVPATRVLEVVRECLSCNVRGLVVITAGFSECGAAGRRQEHELLELVRSAGVRMIGPNCFGVLNTDPDLRLFGTFGPLAAETGHVAVGTQSGALGLVIPDYLRQWRLGISSFASVGNKADVNENDLLEFWEHDPATEVIVLYLESFSAPRDFRRIASRITPRKPVVAIKAGRSAVGQRAAGSHTAALATPDRVADALFRQSGVLRVDTLQEMFDVTSLLANQPLPAARRVGVLTNAGGPAVLCVDTLSAWGLDVPAFSAGLQAQLRSFLRPEAPVGNPIDLIASIDPAEYRRCVELLQASDEVDALITIFVPRERNSSAPIADALRLATATAARPHQRTHLVVCMDSSGVPHELAGPEMRIPGYLFPESAAVALGRAVQYAEFVRRPARNVPASAGLRMEEARQVVDKALARLAPAGGWLEVREVQQVLAACGLHTPRWKLVSTADEAVAAASELQGPAALKVVSPTALHKSDCGGVVVNVTGEAAIRSAFAQVTSAADDARGALVQEFVSSGHEFLIGVTVDPAFGPLIALGAGGIAVELVGDVVYRLTPLMDRDADEMLDSLAAARVLGGFRGQPCGDVDALRDVLFRVSALVGAVPQIIEMDLNPVKVLSAGHGAVVVDSRIRVEPIGVLP